MARCTLLPLLLLAINATATSAQEVATTSILDNIPAAATTAAPTTVAEPAPKEPAWGRIYLRHGLAPVQYFRDNFGAPMVTREVAFQTPAREQDRLLCELLPQDEQDALLEANRSVVLIVDRGECTFERKARLADQMGAAGLVVVSATDDVHGPVAILDDDEPEISIASVMIRHSAGEMLRALIAHMPVFGRLMPMICEREPYTCTPLRQDEKNYITTYSARSGAIFTSDAVKTGEEEADTRLGSFLSATYGSVLPTATPFLLAKPLDSAQACVEVSEDASKTSTLLGKVVIIPEGEAGKCSELEKVSNAQRQGAQAVVIVLGANNTAMAHPTVKQNWYAYNITMPVVAVSSTTGARLQHLMDASGDAASVRFTVNNAIADAWETLAKHSQRSVWPKRQQRRAKLAAKLLTQMRALGGDGELEVALKHVFLSAGGGKVDDWEKIASQEEQVEGTHAALDGSKHESIAAAATKPTERDEL